MTRTESRFERDGLEILIKDGEGNGTVTWRGASDSRNPSEFLDPIVEHIVRRMRGRTLTVDFSGLDYMNSSTVSPIIALLKKVDANEIETLVLFSNIDWQQTHLRCMKAITRVLKHVRVEAKPVPT